MTATPANWISNSLLAVESALVDSAGFRAMLAAADWQGREVYAFTKPGDTEGQSFARALGCAWAGGSDEPSPM